MRSSTLDRPTGAMYSMWFWGALALSSSLLATFLAMGETVTLKRSLVVKSSAAPDSADGAHSTSSSVSPGVVHGGEARALSSAGAEGRWNLGALHWPSLHQVRLSGADSQDEAYLSIHLPSVPNGTAIVICPGGGYSLLWMDTGHAIAAAVAKHGVTGAVLKYRLPHMQPQLPVEDARSALSLLRANAGILRIDPSRVGIMGSSAGGHLAAIAGTHFKDAASRPDFLVLNYPVITMGKKTHRGSRTQLLGRNPSDKLIELYSAEKQVSNQTPPTFLSHALNDHVVSVENSRMFLAALQAHGVAAKYLELPSGGHGGQFVKTNGERCTQEILMWLRQFV
mmetsp:Transcript_78682/g.218519  ORF Transcript_78682/g.218519 Transcript_78682/m.218519 type:complete len:338 (+) Transcript_78682:80-1093(+)